MKERPIIMNAPMARATLDGSKTQTRRIVKRRCTGEIENAEYGVSFGACPYGKPGDKLWVRETHRPIFGQTCGLIAIDYQADPQEKWARMRDHAGRPKWTPSIHMRREYSRILLEIVSVRVERLNDISDADAIAEGIGMNNSAAGVPMTVPAGESMPRAVFRELWETINGAGSWDDNPFVWAITFKRVQP